MTTTWKPSDAQGQQGIAIARLTILKLGHIFREQETNDVGIDAHVELVDQLNAAATGQLIALQIKAGPSFFKEKTDNAVIFRGDQNHLNYWLNHSLPVFLVLVDTGEEKAFWQEISLETVESLEKGWKVAVPFINELATNFVTAARERVGLNVTASSYTRLTLQDTSNAYAKRYSSKILMRPPLTRMRAEAVIRRATADIRKERYNLDGFKKLFGDRDADVVSLYVAGEPHDAEVSNWYCRTMWVSKDLVAEVRPGKLGGIDFEDGLEVVWNTDYSKSSQFYNGLQIDKQAFLTAAKDFTSRTEVLMAEAFDESTQITCSPKRLVTIAASMREVYATSNDIGLPPYECKGASDRFGDVMALADNAFIYATKAQAEPENGGWPYLLKTTLGEYRKNLSRLAYELEKAR